MPQICIVALIGLPGVGKTSFSNWLLNQYSEELPGTIVHFCYDRFLQFSQQIPTATGAVGTDFNYKEQRSQIFKQLVKLVNALQTTVTIPYDLQNKIKAKSDTASTYKIIICDDNHYYRSMRYKLYQFCRANGISFAQIYFKADLAVSIERNNARNAAERIPLDVLEIMSRRLEVPLAKNFWESQTLMVDCNTWDYDLNIINSFIRESLRNLPKHLVEIKESEPQTQSAVHEVDLLLRKQITKILSAIENQDEKRAKAQSLNAKRRSILQTLRENKDQALGIEDFTKFCNSFD